MPFERIADRKIREAMQDGRFDGLSRQGRPIDLEDYFKLPAELRMAYSVLKSAGCLPEEVELFNEIAALDERLAVETDADRRARLRRTRDERRLRLDLALERAKCR